MFMNKSLSNKIRKYPPIRFYFSFLIFLSINILTYLVMFSFIIRRDYGNLGEMGLWIYVFSMISIPVSGYRMLKSAKVESDLSLRLWGLISPFFLACIFIMLGVQAIPILGLFFSIYGYGILPMSWYNFREKRWEEK